MKTNPLINNVRAVAGRAVFFAANFSLQKSKLGTAAVGPTQGAVANKTHGVKSVKSEGAGAAISNWRPASGNAVKTDNPIIRKVGACTLFYQK